MGDLSVTQVSFLIPSYISNWLEKNRKEPYVQEGLRQMPKDNLGHLKAHLLVERWSSFGGHSKNAEIVLRRVKATCFHDAVEITY